MKSINFNQLSELGLISRINTQILHPLGLALSRNPETGYSEKIYVADDQIFHYPYPTNDILSNEEIKQKILEMTKNL